jgi:hypothetical protein
MINNSGSRNSQKNAETPTPYLGFRITSINTMIRNSPAIINEAIKYMAPLGELKNFSG